MNSPRAIFNLSSPFYFAARLGCVADVAGWQKRRAERGDRVSESACARGPSLARARVAFAHRRPHAHLVHPCKRVPTVTVQANLCSGRVKPSLSDSNAAHLNSQYLLMMRHGKPHPHAPARDFCSQALFVSSMATAIRPPPRRHLQLTENHQKQAYNACPVENGASLTGRARLRGYSGHPTAQCDHERQIANLTL